MGDYGYPWDRLIGDLKFSGRSELAAPLAQAMQGMLANQADAAADLVLPVPLSATRLAERGHNQAWEVARRVAAARGAPADAKVLLRLRDTPHQVGLTRSERGANLQHAFWVPPAALPRLAGRGVALVDDVLTTGATADAAARVLLQAGAASVQVWVLARTPAPEA